MSLLKDLVKDLVSFVIENHHEILRTSTPFNDYEHLPAQQLHFFLQSLIQDIVQKTYFDEQDEFIHILYYVTSVIKTVKPLVDKIHPLNAAEQAILIAALKELLINCFLYIMNGNMFDSKPVPVSYLKDNQLGNIPHYRSKTYRDD